MSELADFQAVFGVALAAPDAKVADPALARALAVHRNTCAKAALDALAANYPVVSALVGAESFAACGLAFYAAEPPRAPRLCDYGADFPAFVTAYPPFADAPYVAEVAGLERLFTEALFAADAPVMDGEAFAAGLDLEAACPPHPACRFARFGAPVVGIWLAHQDGAPKDALEHLVWAEDIALVTRPADQVLVTPIGEGALRFLEACEAGSPLGEAAALAAETGDDLASAFTTLITAGAFRA